MGSVGQRAAKILAVNVGGLEKKSAIRPRPQSASLPGFDSRRSRIILKVKDLIPLTTVSKVQEASSILKVGFAFLKCPHFHRAY